jgi:hypothetical protein
VSSDADLLLCLCLVLFLEAPTPNSKTACVVLGAWNLELLWSLVLGAWSFEAEEEAEAEEERRLAGRVT